MSQRELAASVGVGVGGMYYVLNALIDKGLEKLTNFMAVEDKRRYTYVLTPKRIARKAVLTQAFLARKMRNMRRLASNGELATPQTYRRNHDRRLKTK